MSIKHFVVILLLLVLCCGTVSATATTLTVSVYDSNSGNDPIYDAKVTITYDGIDQVRYTDTDGEASFGNVEYQRSYTLKITKDNYDTYQTTLTINSMDKTYSVYLQKGNLIQVKVRDSSTLDAISGATVTVDGYNAGTTNSAGVIHVSMSKDAYHTIKVTSSTYETYSSSQYIDTDQTSLTVSLTRNYYTPLVLVYDADRVALGGASVSIDGKFAGYTDEYGRAQLTKQTAGTYKLTVTKDNFVSYEKSVTFSDDTLDIVVELEYATVPVTILTMDGNNPVTAAYISLDGTVTGFTDATGKYETKLKPGTSVVIAASKDGYSESSLTYQVTATGSNIVTLPLSPILRTEYILAAGLAVIAVLLILILLKTGGRKNRGKRGGGSSGSSGSGRNNSL